MKDSEGQTMTIWYDQEGDFLEIVFEDAVAATLEELEEFGSA